jgi:nucleoside-diphosphate-sugar epimerase
MITSWRPDFEQQIISSTSREHIDAIIIRPGMVFGGASTIYTTWFTALVDAKKNGGVAQVPGKKDALIPTVHKDDLAEAYRLIVEKVRTIFFHSIC